MSSFFHTLVVFGAGASLVSCGAKATSDEGRTTEPSTGGTLSTGGKATLIGGPAAGGRGGTGDEPTLGGAPGTGGSGGTQAPAGTAGAGGVDPATLPQAMLPQLVCDGDWQGCSHIASEAGVESIYLPSDACRIDPTRPRTEADCPATQRFECSRALVGEKVVAVQCQCVPTPLDGSCDECSNQSADRVRAGSAVCNGRTKLCGCVTGILVK